MIESVSLTMIETIAALWRQRHMMMAMMSSKIKVPSPSDVKMTEKIDDDQMMIMAIAA